MTRDLDDLIRQSLAEHAPAESADPTLGETVVRKGRRVRRTRQAAVAAVALVAVAAGAIGVRTVVTSQPTIATPAPLGPGTTSGPTTSGPTTSGPAPSASASVSPSSTPSATGSSTAHAPIVKDITGMGAENDFGGPTSSFASPTGNLWCNISASGAGCQGQKFNAGAQATVDCEGSRVLGDAVVIEGTGKATWQCTTEIFAFPFLDKNKAFTTWWDPAIGDKRSVRTDSGNVLATLRYGNTLTAGDFRCTSAVDGVTCTNTVSGHGFTLSKAGVKRF